MEDYVIVKTIALSTSELSVDKNLYFKMKMC
jgi:hypothetical protein